MFSGAVNRADQPLLLVDHADAAAAWRPRGERICDALPSQQDLAGVGPVEPGQDVHQAGLAGAVFAQQGVDLAALRPRSVASSIATRRRSAC